MNIPLQGYLLVVLNLYNSSHFSFSQFSQSEMDRFLEGFSNELSSGFFSVFFFLDFFPNTIFNVYH